MAGSTGDYKHITTATTTQVKTGKGILKRVIVGDAGTDFTIDVYDDTGGGTNDQILSLAADGNRSLHINTRFAQGLKVVTGGTPGSVTLIYE